MRFTCKKCQAPYTISDDKIRGKVIKVRCKRCNHLIVIRSNSSHSASRPSGAEDPGVLHDSSLELEFEHAFKGIYESANGGSAPPPVPTPTAPPVAAEWFYGLDGSEDGPLSLDQMRAKIADGSISEDHFVWREGMADWVPLEDVPELAKALHARAQHRPPVPAPGKKRSLARQASQVERERENAILLRKTAQAKQRAQELDEQRRREELQAIELERKQQRQALDEFKRRKEEEDKKLRQKQESLRREQERKQREQEKQRLRAEREAEAEKKRLRAEREAEAEKKRLRAEQEAEAEKKRLRAEREAEAEKKRLQAEQEAEAEKKRLRAEREAEAEKKRLQAEQQSAERRKSAEEDRKKRGEIIAHVLKKRDNVRAGRVADRIAQHFFKDGEDDTPESELLPPPPVESGDELAQKLQAESIAEEYEKMQSDPIAVLRERDQPGAGQVSKVSKALIAQAGVATKGRRLGVTAICIIGVVGLVAGVLYLAISRGWFSGIESGLSSAAAGKGKLAGVEQGAGAGDEHLSADDSKRLRSALWDIERDGGVAGAGARSHQGVGGARAPLSMTQREKDLMAFYQRQSSEKNEVAPRGPKSCDTAAGPATIELPSTAGVSPQIDPRTAKIEVRPQGPANGGGPVRLSDLQVQLVIRRHYRNVKSCLERQLKRDASISGKMYVVARVKPNGKVNSARVDTAKFHGTFVEECLLKEIKHWRFPAFNGEAYDLTFPLLLSARQSY